MSRSVFAGYPASPADEAVDPAGGLRAGYDVLEPALERLGAAGLVAAAAALAAERASRGVTASSAWVAG